MTEIATKKFTKIHTHRKCVVFSSYEEDSIYTYETPVDGFFHQWGIHSFPTEAGHIASLSIALVEDKSGNILIVPPDRIRFND